MSTNFHNVVIEDAESKGKGKGDLASQVASIKADLDAIATAVNELKANFNDHTHEYLDNNGTSDTKRASSKASAEAEGTTATTANTIAAATISVTTK